MIKKIAFIGHRIQDSEVCKMAIIQDSEGNGLMLHQIAPDRIKS